MIVINLFFIPAISVYIFYWLSKITLKFDAKLLFAYLISTSVVAFGARLIMALIKFLFDFDRTEPGGVCFFAASFVVALVIPFIANTFKINNKEN